MGKKLSPSRAAIAKADVLNTLDFVDLMECANLGKDALGIVGNIQKADYYCNNITVNNNNYIS